MPQPDPNQNIEQQIDEIFFTLQKETSDAWERYEGTEGDELEEYGEAYENAYHKAKTALASLATSKVNQARYDELEKLLTVGEENITLNDIYGDDRRNNYGYQETQVRDASNHLKRRFTKVIQDRLSTLKEDMK